MLDLDELVFVAQALELAAHGHQVGVLSFESTLLLHHAGDLLGHHFRHLIAHVGLKHVEEGQLLKTLKGLEI